MENNYKVLLKQVRACTLCEPHLPSGAQPVLQVHPEAKILITGQAPGKRVHETGVPFDDPSGDRLRDWMGVDKVIFYDERKIAILPMGFCYPGTGKSGDFAPRPECTPYWREKLLKHLTNIEVTLVIGQYAVAYHLHDMKGKNLTETVRRWQEYWPHKIPLPHPSPRNNIWFKKNPWFGLEVLPILKEKISEYL